MALMKPLPFPGFRVQSSDFTLPACLPFDVESWFGLSLFLPSYYVFIFATFYDCYCFLNSSFSWIILV
jgi:hypothetical protein